MPIRIGNITFDCDDVLKVAASGQRRCGGRSTPEAAPGSPPSAVTILTGPSPPGTSRRFRSSKVAKNRMHLDLVDPDPSAVDRLVALGASIVGEHQIGGGRHSWTVMQDPEGNEFCIAAKSFTG